MYVFLKSVYFIKYSIYIFIRQNLMLLLKTGSHYVVQDSIKLEILLPQPLVNAKINGMHHHI